MWAAMVLAMMVPNLFPLIKDLKVRNHNTAPFILGYLAVWLMFCVMGVGVQWALRLLEVLNGHMMIANPLMSAAVLCLAGAYQVSEYKSHGLKERNKYRVASVRNAALAQSTGLRVLDVVGL